MRQLVYGSLYCGLVTAMICHANDAVAQTYVWDGGGYPNLNWSSNPNWTVTAPLAGGGPVVTLIFPYAGPGNRAVNNMGTFQLDDLILPAAGGINVVEGNALEFTGATATIRDDSEFVNIIKNDLILTQDLTVEVSNASGIELQLIGAISGPGDFTKEGPGILEIHDADASGNIFVEEGTLSIYDSVPFAIGGGNLNVASGAQAETALGPSTDLNGLSGAGDVFLTLSNSTVSIGWNNQSTTFSGGFLNAIAASTLSKRGTGVFTLSGTANGTTFPGDTEVFSGTLVLDRSVANVQGGLITVGDGGGGAEADVLRLDANDQISVASDGGDVVVTSSGLFDMAGFSDEIRSLTINTNGRADTGGGSMTVLESINVDGTLSVNGGTITTPSITTTAGSTVDFEAGTININGGTGSLTSGLFFGGTSQPNQPTMNIQNGATVTGSGSTVGPLPGDYATLNVTGAGSSLSLFNSTVAFRGTGQFNVSDGGHVDILLELAVGSSSGSDGSMLVSGVGGGLRSTVDVTGPSARIRVGLQDTGAVTVENGALVHSAGYVAVGESGTGDGTITIGGNAGGFDATLQADGNLYIGGATGGAGGTGVVNVNTAGQLSVADVTVYTDGELHLAGGGTVTSTGTARIEEGTATVSGTDGSGNASTWNNSLSLIVGTNSTGNLAISGGGQVSNLTGVIGNTSGGDGTVTVSGTDGMGNPSQWTMSSANLLVGNAGAGTLDVLAGGEVTSSGAFIGLGSGSDGTVTVSGTDSRWHNLNDLQVGRGGAGDTGSLDILNDGRVEVDGTLNLYMTGTVTLDGGTLVADTIDHSNLGTFDFSGGVLSVVTFDGNLTNAGGTLAPGNSPGTTSVLGSYSQDASSVLEIELAGTTPGSQFDQVNVTGSATLDGTLEIVLVDPFVPMPGQSFEIMTFASRTGEFDTINGGGLLGDVYLLEQYDATSITLLAAIPGDATLDGQVDIGDFTIWGDGFQSASEFIEGDFSGDGQVDIGDFTIWGDHFGEMVNAPGGSLTAVPEPSSLVMAICGLFVLAPVALRRARSYYAP